MRTPLLLGLITLCACGGAPVGSTAANPASTSDAQTIRLHRGYAAGDSFVATYSGRSENRTLVTVRGQTARDDHQRLDIALTASVNILAVDAIGRSTRREITIQECMTGGDDPQVILPAGAVLDVTLREDAGEILLRGGELSAEQQALLQLVISTHQGHSTDDDIFGSAETRSVGESWPVNSELAAAELGNIPSIGAADATVSGSTRFVGMEDIDGVPCQHLEARMAMDGFTIEDLPPGSDTQSALIEMRMSGAFPTDLALHRLRSEEEMAMQVVTQIPTPDGSMATMSLSMHHVKTTEIRP